MKLVLVLSCVLLFSSFGFSQEARPKNCSKLPYVCQFEVSDELKRGLALNGEMLHVFMDPRRGQEQVCIGTPEDNIPLTEVTIKAHRCKHCYDYSGVLKIDEFELNLGFDGSMRARSGEIQSSLTLSDNNTGETLSLPAGSCEFRR